MAYNIHNFPTRWRFGDVILERYGEKRLSSPDDYSFLTATSGWVEKSIDGVRIKIKPQDTPSQSFKIEMHSLFPNDVIPIVSRSPEVQECINMWTSGNRVFHCTNTSALFVLLENIKELI